MRGFVSFLKPLLAKKMELKQTIHIKNRLQMKGLHRYTPED